jgi:uncharacterized protein (TIGR00251 family)
MKLQIKLHPSSSQEKVKEVVKDKEYEVWIKEKPVEGKANEELVKTLKKYFKKQVTIVHGLKSKDKVVELK